jgi:hypothetical protein
MKYDYRYLPCKEFLKIFSLSWSQLFIQQLLLSDSNKILYIIQYCVTFWYNMFQHWQDLPFSICTMSIYNLKYQFNNIVQLELSDGKTSENPLPTQDRYVC